jgi:hypothetical protein
LIYPVYLLLLQRQGLSYVQISLLLSVWAGSALLLELPSGMLADLWSRKAIIALSTVLKAGGFLIWAIWPNFTGFLLGFILWGAQEAFCSGAEEALLFDALKIENAESAYEAAAGAGETASTAAIASAMIAGGFLFERHPRLTHFLSAFFVLLAGLCALGVAEKGKLFRSQGRGRGAAFGDSLRQLGRAVRETAAVPGLKAFGLLGVAFMAAYGTVEEFDTLYGLHLGVPEGFIGLWGALRFAVVGGGAALASLLRRRLSLIRTGRLLVWMLGAGLALLLGTFSASAWVAPLYFAYYGMFASADVLYQGSLQRRIPSSSRATLSSLVSFLTTGLSMGLGILLALAAERWGLPALFRGGAALSMAAVAVYAATTARRANDHRAKAARPAGDGGLFSLPGSRRAHPGSSPECCPSGGLCPGAGESTPPWAGRCAGRRGPCLPSCSRCRSPTC